MNKLLTRIIPLNKAVLPYPEFKEDLLYCTNIHRKYGKSFYYGTRLMRPEYRDAVCILYAFFRIPDEYVDTEYSQELKNAQEKLLKWKTMWKACLAGKDFEVKSDELRVLRASKYVFDRYAIPHEYSVSFLSAMIQDTTKAEYETYAELEEYMYGSAAVVGIMMVYIMCSKDNAFLTNTAYRDKLISYARALGEAFQMTNFLRDIGEDLVLRDRIYLPQEDMRRFGVTAETLQSQTVTEEFVNLMQFEIEKTKELYQKADKGIRLLPKREARGIAVGRVLYSRILNKIEENGYNVFSTRAHLSVYKKVGTSLLTLITYK
jgi:15-cis-phytoene synthase